MVNIKGLDKARVLKALYDNSSYVRGLNHAPADPKFVTVEHCAQLLEKQTCFDYLYGRLMAVDLSGDEFDENMYDFVCGDGAAQKAVDSVRGEREDGEKNGPNLEEKTRRTTDALEKITNILWELQPDECFAAVTVLRMTLMGPGLMGGPVTPPFPFKGRFR
jgi:hypothetical protein